jgi:hypothetical protein
MVATSPSKIIQHDRPARAPPLQPLTYGTGLRGLGQAHDNGADQELRCRWGHRVAEPPDLLPTGAQNPAAAAERHGRLDLAGFEHPIAPAYVDTGMSAWVHDEVPPQAMIPVEDVVEIVDALLRLSPVRSFPR